MNRRKISIILIKLYALSYDILTSSVDWLLYIFLIPVTGIHIPSATEKKSIVYVNDRMIVRSSRIAKWVKRNGNFFTILLCSRLNFIEKFSGSEWDKVILYRNKYHVLRILRQMDQVYLFHGFAPKSFYPDLVRQQVKVPFLIDMQDVYACYYGLNPTVRWLKKELPLEKKCLQLSDGLIGQSLEPNVALRKYGKIKPPALFFPIYCDNDFFQNNNKTLDTDNIHFVYAGGVAGSQRDKSQFGLIQFHNLIKILSGQQIHFHIYPSPSNFKADYEEYEQISSQNKYFHFHHSVSQEELAKELSNYHFGVLPFFRSQSGQSTDKFKYATTLKLFNYIEAGIPILVSEDLIYQNWIIKRNHAGITITETDLYRIKKIIQALDYPALVAELIKKREDISLKAHVPRLLDFYQQVSDKFN